MPARLSNTPTRLTDPFGSFRRVQSDRVGVRHWEKNLVQHGFIIFHTVVGNRLLVIDLSGKVILEFRKTPPGYQFYRPGKAGDKRNVYCILKSTDNPADRAIASLNEDGKVLWRTRHHHFTHDFHIRHNRMIVTVLREERVFAGVHLSNNVLCEMDIDGEISWRWSLLDNIDQFRAGALYRDGITTFGNDNPFHVNSVQIADYDSVLERFGEPAILASARNMNSVFLVGRRSGRVLFEYSGQTLGQHHARLLPEIYPSGKNIIIVDNGNNFLPPETDYCRGYSRLLEVAVPSGDVVWEYRSKPDQPLFFSPIVGAQQRFVDGHTLITEGYFGRLFEIDYEGNILWDYIYPEANELADHLKITTLRQTGLRQIYRAYKVNDDWME